VTVHFPTFGNTGTNPKMKRDDRSVAAGMVVKWDATDPSNWRAVHDLSTWLAARRVALPSAGSTPRPA